MDDTYDERSADEQGGAASGAASAIDPALFPPSLIIPDQDGQILQTWFATADLPAHIEQLEQQIQQLAQEVATIQRDLENVSRQQFLHGRSVAFIIGDICTHLGFDPVSGESTS